MPVTVVQPGFIYRSDRAGGGCGRGYPSRGREIFENSCMKTTFSCTLNAIIMGSLCSGIDQFPPLFLKFLLILSQIKRNIFLSCFFFLVFFSFSLFVFCFLFSFSFFFLFFSLSSSPPPPFSGVIGPSGGSLRPLPPPPP